MGKTEKQIINLLKNSDSPLTLNEIAEILEKKPKAVFRSLRKLFQEGKIVCDPKTKRYTVDREM